MQIIHQDNVAGFVGGHTYWWLPQQVLSGRVASVGISDGEMLAAATSFDNRPFKPDTIFVPS